MKALRRGKALLLCLLATGLLGGCSSGFVTVSPRPAADAKPLSRAEGESCGVAPFNVRSRIRTAYERALATAPGAVALADVTIEENWFYAVLPIWCTKVTGEAIR